MYLYFLIYNSIQYRGFLNKVNTRSMSLHSVDWCFHVHIIYSSGPSLVMHALIYCYTIIVYKHPVLFIKLVVFLFKSLVDVDYVQE